MEFWEINQKEVGKTQQMESTGTGYELECMVKKKQLSVLINPLSKWFNNLMEGRKAMPEW